MSEFVFRSGKHKGRSLQIVQAIDPGYFAWIKENRPEMLEESKEKKKPMKAAPRIEPPEVSSGAKSAIQPNLNFWNEKGGIH